MNTKHKYLIISILVIIIITISISVTAELLSKQEFPTINSAQTVSMCDYLTGPDKVGGPGPIKFTCPYFGHAFRSLANATGIPSFTLPSGYLSLVLIHVGTDVSILDSCSNATGSITLYSGNRINFPSIYTEWDYCLDVYFVPQNGFSEFDVLWYP